MPARRYPAARRVVAVGDVHGDLAAARRALRLAGATDAEGRWIGGDLVLVQTGDILDRGDDERAILDWLAELSLQAEAAGGALYRVLGNHETMNARGDFRYVTAKGFTAFADLALTKQPGRPAPSASTASSGRGGGGARQGVLTAAAVRMLERLPLEQRGRAAAFFPGGLYARALAPLGAVLIVGDTAFAHGGVLPQWADYGIDLINTDIACWLTGEADMPALLQQTNNPLWSRDYSTVPEHCDALAQALSKLGVRRMVVAHTPQKGGISSACDDRVWRIDTGMARHYGGPIEVLEIQGQDITVLREP